VAGIRKRRYGYGARRPALLALVLVLALGGARAAFAGTTIVVANGDVGGLIGAISDANSETGIFVGTDTIELAPGGTYVLTGINNVDAGNNGLPTITSTIVIEAHGSTIRRSTAAGVPLVRIFNVDSAGSLTLREATIRNGRASNGGGIRALGPVSLERSTIADNASLGDAGGVYALGSAATLTVSNSTFSGNSSGASGGALYVAGAVTASILNTTITGNSATLNAGGVGNSSPSTSYQNTIVAGNNAPSQADCGSLQPLISNGNNLVGAGTGCTTGIGDLTTSNVAAELDPTLADNGGPTPTHALIAGSQAIDAAANGACPTTDQRGRMRVDGDGDSVVTCDIGSFEFAATDADLGALTTSAGTLAPPFDAATTSYDAGSVPNGTSSVTVTPTAAESHATIQVRINGGAFAAVASGLPSGPLALNEGANTIEVLVTAQDGVTTKTYSIAITRLPAVSSNASLGNLTITAGTLSPVFSSATTSYSAGTVANGIATVRVTPTAADSNATIRLKVNAGAFAIVASGAQSGPLALHVGSNTIQVKVTAQDGVTTKTYSITITRAAGGGTISGSFACAGTFSGLIVTGALTVPAGANCRLTGGAVNGAVQVLAGASFWGSGGLKIGGSFQAVNAAWVKLDQVTTGGDVQLVALTSLPPAAVASSICRSSIGGSLQVVNNTRRVSIGDNPPCTAAGGNAIKGTVQVNGNTALVRVSRNTIGGSLSCTGNTPAASGLAGSNSAASKSGQCAGL
jgi:cadherin-like protein